MNDEKTTKETNPIEDKENTERVQTQTINGVTYEVRKTPKGAQPAVTTVTWHNKQEVK